MEVYRKEYFTPYGKYVIRSKGEYIPGISVDNTKISPDSICNHGGFDILCDNGFITKCKTLDEAKITLVDILKYSHRYNLELHQCS